jgi:polyhydroxyalkanoate synthesis repressor PhaR
MTMSSFMAGSFRGLGVDSARARRASSTVSIYVIRTRSAADKTKGPDAGGRIAPNALAHHKTVAAPTETAYFEGEGTRFQTLMSETQTKAPEPVEIKKYANRRLYNTGTSAYVTLEDLAAMVKSGEDFIVHDAKSGDDITRSVLTQIIFEQENKQGQNLLPITFLRQLIRFYGDSMQMLVPRYLEVSIESLTREQEKFRQQMAQAFGVGAFTSLEEQVRRNMEMFERAFAMFAPFARRESQAGGTGEGEKPPTKSGEIDELKRQIEEMQKKVNRLTDKDKGGN